MIVRLLENGYAWIGGLASRREQEPTKKNVDRLSSLEGKSNLMRMRQEIPLSEAEAAALDDGVCALESLLARLSKVPTPAGPTPLQLRGESLVQIDWARAVD
jgi:hypothetical protein